MQRHLCVLLVGLAMGGCTREIIEFPTAPPIANNPAPAPTPTPQVLPTPTPAPTPQPTPAASSDCPTLLGLRLDILHVDTARNRVILDLTPLTEQCQVNFPGRLNCPLGQAGTQKRADCEAVRIGKEGPEWSLQPYGQAELRPLPDTYFTAELKGKGVVTVCSRVQPDVCTYREIR